MIAMIDLDGVIADFIGGACKVHNVPNPYLDKKNRGPDFWDIEKVLNIPSDKFWKDMEEDFWENLSFTPEGSEILSIVESYFGEENCCLLTTPSYNVGCSTGKMKWIKNNLPQYYRRFFIGVPKYFLARKYSVLIDDSDANINKFRKYGGQGILIPRPWNTMHMNEVGLLTHLKHSLEELED